MGLDLNLENFSERKLELLRKCYSAIDIADDAKIEAAYDEHFSDDTWLEEQCTPTYPEIRVQSTGIGNFLYINKKECTDDSYDP